MLVSTYIYLHLFTYLWEFYQNISIYKSLQITSINSRCKPLHVFNCIYKPPCLHLCTLIYILFPYMQFLCFHFPFLEQYEFSMLSTLMGFYNFAPLF